MNCPNCFAEIDDNARFCPNCGTNVEAFSGAAANGATSEAPTPIEAAPVHDEADPATDTTATAASVAGVAAAGVAGAANPQAQYVPPTANYNEQQYAQPQQQYGQQPYGQAQYQQPAQQYAQPAQPRTKSKVTAGILGILLGGLGIHKFYLGYTVPGVILLAVWLIGLFLGMIPSAIAGIIGLIEGILYLTKSDEEFYNTYVANQRQWF